MPDCGSRASLLVTITPMDTTTNVVRRRVDLHCGLPPGHEGPHRDAKHGEEWESTVGRPSTILRHEDDDV